MNYTSLTARFQKWQAETRRALITEEAEHRADSPEWYAGLAVSPAAFSRQLGEMQLSLLRANTAEAGNADSARAGMANGQRA